MTKQTVLVQDLRPVLTEALERLMAKDEARRGFVIVDHEPTGQYLQFCTELGTGALLFDRGGWSNVPRPQSDWEAKPVPDVRSGVVAAEVFMRGYKGWALCSEDEVSITEDDTESGRRRLIRKAREWLAELGEKLGAAVPAPAEA